ACHDQITSPRPIAWDQDQGPSLPSPAQQRTVAGAVGFGTHRGTSSSSEGGSASWSAACCIFPRNRFGQVLMTICCGRQYCWSTRPTPPPCIFASTPTPKRWSDSPF